MAGLALYNYGYKEKEMEKAKKVRPTKKALVNDIIKLGVDPKVAMAGSRSNIEALELVKGLLTS